MNKRKIGVVYRVRNCTKVYRCIDARKKSKQNSKMLPFAFQNKRGAVKFFFLIERDEQ